jgi:hypothetical protein
MLFCVFCIVNTKSRGIIPGFFYFIPNIFPNLFLLPDLVVGTPVHLANLRFALVTPKARFQLKERPGILKLDFFFAMSNSSFLYGLQLPQGE